MLGEHEGVTIFIDNLLCCSNTCIIRESVVQRLMIWSLNSKRFVWSLSSNDYHVYL